MTCEKCENHLTVPENENLNGENNDQASLKTGYAYPQKIPLHYQDPRGFAKTIFLDSLNACKDMLNAGS